MSNVVKTNEFVKKMLKLGENYTAFADRILSSGMNHQAKAGDIDGKTYLSQILMLCLANLVDPDLKQIDQI